MMPTTSLGASTKGGCAQSTDIDKKATKEEITLIIVLNCREPFKYPTSFLAFGLTRSVCF